MKNFLKINKFSIFNDYYLYIDVPKYKMDDVLMNYGDLDVEFLETEFTKPDSVFIFSMIRAPKRFREIIQDEIFPELDRKMWELFGDEYIQFANSFEEYCNSVG